MDHVSEVNTMLCYVMLCYVSLCEGLRAGAGSLSYIVPLAYTSIVVVCLRLVIKNVVIITVINSMR